MAAKKMGRPPKPPSEVRKVVFPLRVTKEEYKQFRELAHASGETVADLLRRGGLERGQKLRKRRK